MKSSLTNLLTEVIIFPYSEEEVTALEQACDTYVESITLSQYEGCVLHLCLDLPSAEMMLSINTVTGKKYPQRVYRALAGYIVGCALDKVADGENKVKYVLILRNVLKVHEQGASGLVQKSIEPSLFELVEDYWYEKAAMTDLDDNETVEKLIANDVWDDTGLEITDVYDDLKLMAQFCCRAEFEKKYSNYKVADSADQYVAAADIARDMTKQSWLFVATEPITMLKGMGFKRGAVTLSSIKVRLAEHPIPDDEIIEPSSVYLSYLYADDYPEIGATRVSPLHFAMSLFYEYMYERIKNNGNDE